MVFKNSESMFGLRLMEKLSANMSTSLTGCCSLRCKVAEFRARSHSGRADKRLPESLTARGTTGPFVGDDELGILSLGKTESTALPCDMCTDLYAATESLWKVE